METIVRVLRISTLKTPLFALPVFGSLRRNQAIELVDDLLGGELRRLAKEEGFQGKAGQLLVLTAPGALKASRAALVGLGTQEARPEGQLRAYAHQVGRLARDKGLTRFVIAAPSLRGVELNDVVRCLTEGVKSGTYRFETFLTGPRKPKKEPKQCVIALLRDADGHTKTTPELDVAVRWGEASMEGISLARDLVNSPANELSPQELAERARHMATTSQLEISVQGRDELEQQGMRLLAAVGRGSANEPRFVHLTYLPKDGVTRGKIALVGKGITFDSGGLSLKTAKGQIDMKCDMAGAAVVIGALRAIALRGLPYEVHGLIPAAENMPGASAYRPGDVVVAKNGRSVEVLNTDAEGRLILADALACAAELKPDVIIDFATLTGACMAALGPYRAGLFANDDQWSKRYAAAAERAGEPLWEMPLASELREGLKSQIADLRNVGGSWGGAITAALFLKEFVGKVPWLHVDIAGPAYLEKPRSFYPKGGTGYGILTVLELLRSAR